MADNCTINFSHVPKVDSVIRELEHNNPTNCYRLAELISDVKFIEYVKADPQGKDVTTIESLEKLDKTDVRRLIRDYKISKVFNVKSSSNVDINSGHYGFSSYEAFAVGLQYHIDTLAFMDITSDSSIKRKKDYINTLIADTKIEYVYQLGDIANKYGNFEVEDELFIEVTDENGNNIEELNQELINSMILAIKENGEETEKNFADFVGVAIYKQAFWTEAFYNNKISHLRGNFDELSDEEFRNAINEHEDEGTTDDTSDYDDTVNSNEQWSISKTPANFQKLIKENIKNYLNTLPRLLNPYQNADGMWEADKTNALGVVTYHNYQECSVEIIGAMNAMGGFKSKEDLLKALRIIAENKSEFAAFAKLAQDLENDDDMFNNFYSSFSNFVFDKLEARVGIGGSVEVGQSNNNNVSERKLYFNLRNDFKASCLQNNNIEHNERIADVKSGDSLFDKVANLRSKRTKYKDTADTTYQQMLVEEENKLVEEIKSLFKIYFPSINALTIDRFIIKNLNKRNEVDRLDNISTLLSMLANLTKAGIASTTSYESQLYERNRIYAENIKAEKAYNIALEMGQVGKRPEPKPTPVFKDFLESADNALSDIAKALDPYAYSKAELNSRTVDNKLSSDVGYNNMITNVVKICKDKELLKAWLKEKMKSTEYDYSNILIDNEAQGIRGLFRKTASGEYVLTDYADTLIDTYLLNGAINENTDANADYTKMSDADYFLTGFYAFLNETKGYKKYNTNKKYTVRTAPFLMRIPSDAPKNFAVTMPRYTSEGLYTYDTKVINKYVTDESAKLKLKTLEDAELSLMLTSAPNISQSITVDELATIMVNGQSSFKIDKNKIVAVKDGKSKLVSGNTIQISYVVTDKDSYDYIVFEGIYEEKDNQSYITDAKIIGRTGSGVNIMSTIKTKLEQKYKRENTDARKINKNHAFFNAFKNILKGEIFDYYKALEDIKNYKKEDLIEWFHYNPKSDKPLSALTGNAFKFLKLDDKVGIDVDTRVKEILSSTGGQTLLTNYSKDVTNNAKIDFSSIEEQLDKLVQDWMEAYIDYSINTTHSKFKHFVENLNNDDIGDYLMNSYIHFNSFDDLFEGNSKYYANPQTFLKRAKEAQAGGTSYAITNYIKTPDNTSPYTQSVQDLGVDLGISVNGKPVSLRSGWYGVTIFNTVRGSTNSNSLYEQLIAAGSNEETAKEIAKGFGLPYTNEKGDTKEDTTKVNDAQSYITIYEAARRLKILGEYPKYKTLIEKLTDNTTELKDINPNELEGFLQVMKNFYFDHYYNSKFGRHLPRQIKNAEYVLVPKFLKDTSLGKLADIMIELDIDQINTQETSKAANYSTLTFWDNNGVATEESIEAFRQAAPAVKQPFSYMYLYKQQDVPQHLVDARNKAGIQVMKKILDNIADFSIKEHNHALNFINAYVANIKEDFDTLLDNYGIKFDSNYNIISKDGKAVNYKKVYDLALQEASRLGLDSNMIDYLLVRDGERPTMPNFMNVVASKIESIAQSQFNKFVTRQKLPGWHAAQVTSVGMEKLVAEYRKEAITDEGKRVELRYHPKINGKQEAYAEVLLPKWAKTMFNKYDKNGNLVKEIRIEDCDEEVLKCLGYRIPTEGKQSMAVLKVVGFLPEWMGSTIVVPDEWVSQTGSDFDVDSIYGISFETYIGKDGRVHKVQYIDGDNEESAFIRYAKYVNYNTDKLIKEEFPPLLTEEEYAELKRKAKAVVLETNKDLEEWYHKTIKSKIENEQTEAWNELSEELQDKFKVLQKELKDNKIQFKDRVSRILDEIRDLELQGYDESGLQKFKKAYEEIRDTISEQIDFSKSVFENVGELLQGANKEYFRNSVINRAAAAELMTFEQFQRLSIEAQNLRKARNNRILESMINIMEDSNSLEEQLSRSNFDDITEAIKKVDKLKGVEGTKANVNNLFDQIQFHRNAMGGATLKAFSVARDTGTSVFNVTKARLTTPIYVKYSDNVNMDVVREGFDVDEYGVVKHEGLGNSKNNKNVVGQYITVASSHTTAHILDAIKEGAIENENEYTFAAFKTLFDLGVDAYTAILWIRQPGISRIVEAYYENESVFQRGYGNPIYTAIKNIARELKVTVNNEIVTAANSIQDVMDALQEQYGDIFASMFADSKISFNNEPTSEVNIINVRWMEDVLEGAGYTEDYEPLLDELATILQFNHINEIASVIANHVKILNPDKFGAKQTIYSTRKVLKDIGKLLTNKEADKIMCGDKTLIQAIYNGAMASPTGGLNWAAYLDGDNNQSVYKPLDAFLRYSTLPSIMINKGLFDTERNDFVNAIEEIETYLDMPITEDIYNDFKKYVLTDSYKTNSYIIREPIILDKFNHIAKDNEKIEASTLEGRNPVEEETNRIYGYGVRPDHDVTIKNVSKPTKEEIKAFNNLTPGQKVAFIQAHLDGAERTIFDYLKVNLYNEYEFKNKGVSSHSVRFDDQQTDSNVIYNLFQEAFDNANPLIRLTAIDLIKYAFVVEGFSFRKGNITKIIKNDALFTPIHERGTGIVDDIKDMVQDIDINTLRGIDENKINKTNLYEAYIRSHSTMKQIKSYRVKYNNKNVANIGVISGTNGMYHFDISSTKDLNLAKEIGLVKEINTDEGLKNKTGVKYINIINKKKTTLYKVVTLEENGNVIDMYLYPLNLLESYESSEFSSNKINNLYPGVEYYEQMITLLFNNRDKQVKDFINEKNEVFSQETAKKYRYKAPKAVKENVVPTNNLFINEAANSGNHSSIKKMVDDVNRLMFDHDGIKGQKLIWCWVPDDLMKTSFQTKGIPSIQIIPDANGVPREYLITRVKRVGKVKKPTEGQENGINIAKRNGVKVFDDIYSIRRYEPKKEEVKNETVHYSSIDLDRVVYDASVSGKVAQQMTKDIRSRSIRGNDEAALITYRDIKSIGFDEYNREVIESRKQDTIKMAVQYYRGAIDDIRKEFDEFMHDPDGGPDDYFTVEDPKVIDAISEDENLRNRYISLALKASTFGKSFELINQIPEDELSVETRQLIGELINSIRNLRESKTVANMFNIVNDFIWAKLSTNPLIKDGFTDIANYIIRDASTLDWLFQDTQEIAIPMVQIILNQVKSKFNTRLMEVEPQVINYKKAEQKIIEAARAAGVEINWNNIVNPETGRFILNYDEKFFDDERELDLAVKNARIDFGEHSKEYLRAKHNYNKWLVENKEQQYVTDFYKAMVENEDKVMTDDMIDYYIKYIILKDEYHKLLGQAKADKTEKTYNRIKQLRHDMNQMMDIHDDVTGEYKEQKEIERANILKSYFNRDEEIRKAYFVRETRLGFKKDLEHYLGIVNKHNKKVNGKQIRSEYELLQIPEYATAVEWLNENTHYGPNEDFRKALDEAYAKINNNKKREYPQFTNIIKATKNAKDAYGVINGMMFNDAQIKAIKDEQENIYAIEMKDISGEARLIRNRPDNQEIYSEEFYKGFKTSDDSLNRRKNATIKAINEILVKALHPITGKVKLSDLSIDDLNELANLYNNLSDIKANEEKDPKVSKFIKEEVEFHIDDLAFIEDKNEAINKDKFEKGYLKAFYKVAGRKEFKNGELLGINHSKGNTDIYGYVTPKHKKDGSLKNPNYLDEVKTEARKFITDNVDMVPTQYYEEAREKAKKEGKLKEWEKANHVYNPYTRRLEPLRIWTRRRYREHIPINFRPTYRNTKPSPKPNTVNSNYNRFSSNYKTTGRYGKTYQGNAYEAQLRDLMINTIHTLAGENHTAMDFIAQDFAPRRGRIDATLLNSANALANAFGFGQSLDPDRHFSKHIGFEYDKEANIPMLNHIKAKGYKQPIKLEERGLTEDDTHYQERVKAVREENEKIKQHNLAIEAAAMDKDYSSVMEQFIREALLTKARQESKLDVYYLLEYLRSQANAYNMNTFGGLTVDKELTTEDKKIYETKTPQRALEMVETWSKRFLFDEYRPKAKFDKAAAVMQNIASAKFMMMNITGGIGNLLTGSTNIFMERFANEYFSHSAWEAAKFHYYLPNTVGFLLNSGKSTSDNLVDAIIKLMGIVDYNGVSETARSINSIEIIEKLRNYAYSPQTAGEHFMQNTAMFAMMIDNKIVNEGGKIEIMSYARYVAHVEEKVMNNLLDGNERLSKLYKDFMKNIKSDKNKLKDYHWFKKDFNSEFLRTIVREGQIGKEIGKEYASIRNKMLDEAKQKFDTYESVISQFELDKDTGLAKLKDGSLINLGHLGKFKEKVVSTNKKIHGVYDKLGGAQIESRWVFGSLLMQYHKYIYMGAMKHWRSNGYYNESRESIERGFIQSLWKFLSIEFYDINRRTKMTAEQEDITKFYAAMQVVGRSFINTFLNWKFNAQVMSRAELRNIRRALGDFVGIATGLLGGIAANCAIIGAGDDDGVMSKMANLALYQMDRLSSEVAVFSYGAITEIEKLYSNPVAIGQTFTDLQNSFGFIFKYFMEGDEFNPYYTTGRYKGEHKLKVYFERQIPIWRNIDRIRNIDQNNKYYKLGDNMLSIVPAKDIAEWIME